MGTVNSKISARTFRKTSHMRSFVKIKPLQNGKITLSFIDIGKPWLSRDFFTLLICLLNANRKNKILTKISESTVSNKHCLLALFHTIWLSLAEIVPNMKFVQESYFAQLSELYTFKLMCQSQQ